MNHPIEPSAAMRKAAHELRAMYLALISEGFAPEEAMRIIAISISAGMKGES